MRIRPLSLVILAIGLLSTNSRAHYGLEETKQVPINRLFINLERRLAQDTNDFEVTYHLARLHSMAYATNLTEVKVTKKDDSPVFYYPGSDAGVPQNVLTKPKPNDERIALQHLTNAIHLYQRAIVLLKQSTNVAEQRWLVLPLELGRAWCLDQAGRRNEAIAAYRKTLKIAWKQEVVGDFDLKEWVSDVWDDIRAGKNPIHVRRRGYIGPGVCYSEEVIGYLLKLLDPVTDAKEIAELKKDQLTIQSMGRAITPILVPLQADDSLAELVDPQAQVSFDLDGSGKPRRWGWITPKAAWLVFDADGNGRITSALQMFGNVTFWIFWHDGYDALAALDANGDGVLQGDELRGLALWRDLNSDGVSDPGEVHPLDYYGITAIACKKVVDSSGLAWNPCGVTFSNGTSRATYDWMAPSFPVDALASDGPLNNQPTPTETN